MMQKPSLISLWMIETLVGSHLIAIFRNKIDADFFVKSVKSEIPLTIREVSARYGLITVSFD